ncbi:hypothetical protein SPBR_05407 [Sporothrix brasiliensis 5110]|uniref:Stress-response A/B barrel domain-containing protein n=1 Tax=Sporothrix brasiliensis 5110 TaxID=1398154 RepID=A0A0C2IQH9_9PEZI|nr:uncharacterized protein SPBR_05407 [Sporothrix brasiliensis 5110]KIH87317.1 hypothetical protein SPBR_05407 [Sporothrix brasiliensis 5110]
MSLVHTVLLQFKEDAAPETVKEPYILSIKGGRDNSAEGMQGGITHGFVVEFATAADRDYYAKNDPAHLAYAASLRALVTKAVVVDFADGVY